MTKCNGQHRLLITKVCHYGTMLVLLKRAYSRAKDAAIDMECWTEAKSNHPPVLAISFMLSRGLSFVIHNHIGNTSVLIPLLVNVVTGFFGNQQYGGGSLSLSFSLFHCLCFTGFEK